MELSRRVRLGLAAVALTVVTASLAYSLFSLMIHAMIFMAGIGLAAILIVVYAGIKILLREFMRAVPEDRS